MNKIIGLVIFPFAGFALALLSASAGAATLEGTVRDAAGRPIKGAVIRVEAKNFSKVITTDARGHYIANNLAAADYKVTLIVDGQIKASIADTRTQAAKPTQLNFDLPQVKRKTHHRVWVANPTGTLIGGTGHWIDVDENGVPVDDANRPKAGTNPVDTSTGAALRAPNAIRPSSKPGG
jgi:hypothetical protein